MIMLEGIKIFFKKSWGTIAAIAAGVAALIGFFLVRKSEETTASVPFKDIQDSHTKEIEEVKQTVAVETKQLAENEAKHDVIVAQIEAQHVEAKKTFDEKKKAEVKQIVKDYANKPEELANKLAEVTGFKVILPEE
jgi:hypothetical protein